MPVKNGNDIPFLDLDAPEEEIPFLDLDAPVADQVIQAKSNEIPFLDLETPENNNLQALKGMLSVPEFESQLSNETDIEQLVGNERSPLINTAFTPAVEGVMDSFEVAYRPVRAAIATVLSPTTKEVELSDVPAIFKGEKFKNTNEIMKPALENLGLEKEFKTSYIDTLQKSSPILGSLAKLTYNELKGSGILSKEMTDLAEREITFDTSDITGLAAELGVGFGMGKGLIKGVSAATKFASGVSPMLAKTLNGTEKVINTLIDVTYGGKPMGETDNVLADSLKRDYNQARAELRKTRRALEQTSRDMFNTTGEAKAKILNVWDKQAASISNTMNKIDRRAGTNITEQFRKITEAVHRIDSELPELSKFYSNRLSNLKQYNVSMEEATELMSQLGYGGNVKGSKSAILKRLNGDENAFNSLVEVRKQMDGMYNDMASVRLNDITESVQKVVDVDGVSNKTRQIIAENFNSLSEQLAKDPSLVQKVSGDNQVLFEYLTKGLPKLDKESSAIKKSIQKALGNHEEFRYVDNYVRSQVKEEYLLDYIHTGKKKPRAEQLIQGKIDTPGLMKERFDAIPEYKLERNFETIVDRYTRTYLDYKYMKNAIKDLPTEINKLRNISMMDKGEMSSFMDNIGRSINEASINKKYAHIQDDIYENMKRIKGEELTNIERKVLDDFVSKHEAPLKELEKVRNAGNVDVDTAMKITDDVEDALKILREAPEMVEEAIPGVILKLKALRGAALKDINNKNVAYKIEKIINKLEKKMDIINTEKILKEEVTSPAMQKQLDEMMATGVIDDGIPASEFKWLEGFEPENLRDTDILRGADPYANINLAEMDVVPAKQVLDAKLEKEIDETVRFVRGAYNKVDDNLVRGGELLRIVDNGKAEGEIFELIEQYKQGGSPVITTDAADYMDGWFLDALGYGSREEKMLNGKIADGLKKYFPKNTKLGNAMVSALDEIGLKINKKASLSDLADVLRTEVYTNLIGFKTGNVIRNLFQPFLHTLPQLRVGVKDKAILIKRMAEHFVNPASWKEFRETALKSDFILSDIDKVKKAIFDRNTPGLGKAIGNAWDAKNKTFMFLYNTSDLINRFNAYHMAKEAAKLTLGKKDAAKAVRKLLNPAYVKTGDRVSLLRKLTQEGSESFINSYARLMTDQTQFIYKNIEKAPFLRNKFMRLAIMFSKWPTEIATREAHYVGELFRGNPEGLKAIAREFMYGLGLFYVGKNLLNLDLTGFAPQASLGVPATTPAFRAAGKYSEGVGEVAKELAINYTPLGGAKTIVKTVNQVIGNDPYKNRLGLQKYQEGNIPKFYKMTPLGMFRSATEDTDESPF